MILSRRIMPVEDPGKVQMRYITASRYFNDAQRQATKDAGKIEGFRSRLNYQQNQQRSI